MPTAGSSSIRDVERIAGSEEVHVNISNLFQEDSLEGITQICGVTGEACSVTPPGGKFSIVFAINVDELPDISLIADNLFFSDDSYSSEVTDGVIIEGITFARGKLTGTRDEDSSPFEFETFSGWLEGSIFGTVQIKFGAPDSDEQYRFVSYHTGVPAGTNPEATGSETTAIWEGATVASIKSDRSFIRGDATITVNFTDANVDLMFNNWHNIDGQALPNMDPITYKEITSFANGGFSLVRNNIPEAFGSFYGTGHEEVGGWFNNEDVTGAFAGTRQEAQ